MEKTSIVEIFIPGNLPENLPENEQGEDEIVFELNEVMEDVGILYCLLLYLLL